MHERYDLDVDALLERDRTGPCFICQIVTGHPDYPTHYVYEDATTIAFLDTHPPEYGWTLVAPRAHREQVTGDFTVDEYLHVQRVVYGVSEAVRQAVDAERMYLCSFGRTQGNAHVHWHIGPVPRGLPFEAQGPGIFRPSRIRMTDADYVTLAQRVRQRLHPV